MKIILVRLFKCLTNLKRKINTMSVKLEEFDCSQCMMCKFEANIKPNIVNAWKTDKFKFMGFIASFMLKSDLADDYKDMLLDLLVRCQDVITGFSTLKYAIMNDVVLNFKQQNIIIESISLFLQ